MCLGCGCSKVTHTHMSPVFEAREDHWSVSFKAMGGPCEVLVESAGQADVENIAQIASNEAWRIEQKFSRYLPGNIIHRVNLCETDAVELDRETVGLIEFAFVMHTLSNGLFDITSGVLRKAWTFDGSSNLPATNSVAALLPLIGLEHIQWNAPMIRLPKGMQLDLGGIGKEYAVDRVANMLRESCDSSCLVNFGGDLALSRSRAEDSAWKVGIAGSERRVALADGALATSGDANRYLFAHGRRYSHILNPLTGWPVENAPRSITVLGTTCTQAGMLSTLAMLRGADAEDFLEEEGVKYWCQR